MSFVRVVGPQQAIELFGIRLVGVSVENLKKLLMSAFLLLLIFLLRRFLQLMVNAVAKRWRDEWKVFLLRQITQVTTTFILILGLLSIWSNRPENLAAALGLVTVGLTFALQKVVTAIAGYFIILRSRIFTVGDRIVMGGVRGDVIRLGLTHTLIMEMGEPVVAREKEEDTVVWVQGRQYTGRVVTVTNDSIFNKPVYNYTRDFPYMWEEMTIPIPYKADYKRAEQIMLEAAKCYTVTVEKESAEALEKLRRLFFLEKEEIGPRVYFRLTDDWVELSLRFITRDSGQRQIKDAVTREILTGFEKAGIDIANENFEVSKVGPLKVSLDK
jgi:small-conductance mechanosensitive channel